MVRAKNRPDGMTAPTCSGFSIHDRRKRTSSSRRGFFNARTDDCKGIVSTRRDRGILRWMSENGHKDVQGGGGAVKPNGVRGGASTTTWTYMSPVWRERSTGMPLEAIRKRRAVWVPAGTFTLVLPLSMVGTSNSPPNAAVTIEIGTLQCRSAPSRWKNSCAVNERKI